MRTRWRHQHPTRRTSRWTTMRTRSSRSASSPPAGSLQTVYDPCIQPFLVALVAYSIGSHVPVPLALSAHCRIFIARCIARCTTTFRLLTPYDLTSCFRLYTNPYYCQGPF